jgi:hypothetical protein
MKQRELTMRFHDQEFRTSPRSAKRRIFGLAWAPLFCFTAGCGASDVGGSSSAPDDESAQVSQAFTPTQPNVRPNINSLTPSARAGLRSGILEFITESILDEHANAHDWHHPSVGELFFSRHHDYLKKLENFFLAAGLPQFVPIPEWDPGTPIPAEFLVTDPLVSQAPLNQNPNRAIPPQFADNQLCKFSTASDMAIQVESWHDGVHGAVGGAMGSLDQAPGAPIFWIWHGLLDDMYHERTWRCETLPAIVTVIRT